MTTNAPLATYSPAAIRAKEDELASWELRLADALEKYMNATSRNQVTRALTWHNIRSVVMHLRGQVQSMKRRTG